jgi:ankyrin repeat protein
LVFLKDFHFASKYFPRWDPVEASFWGNIEAVRALLAAGADRKAQDHDDRTAQQIAEEIGQMKIVELLNE